MTLDIVNDAGPPTSAPQVVRRRLVVPSLNVPWLQPLRSIGGFFATSLDIFVAIFKRPFPWLEFLEQTLFVARVSTLTALVLSIPYVVTSTFMINVLLGELGAADLSGVGASVSAVGQLGPFVTVIVVAGAGASAMCADLGARTIREEIDALRVMGIDPVRALMVPRVLAATTVAALLCSLVTIAGLVGAFLFSVFFQHVTPGAFASGLTLITGSGDLMVNLVKASLFGLTAGLIACHQGTHVTRGPAAVGNAVNETVVLSFLALLVINVVVTAVGYEVLK
jgi:phospholipid/cholesterol/gamma-HCH transport system permease protein